MRYNSTRTWRRICATFFYLLMKLQVINFAVLPGIRSVIRVRSGTSDTGSFRQVFKEDQLALPFIAPVQTIIDCGANIGLTTVAFANAFPGAQILAVEPDESNFEMLLRNVSDYGVTTLLAGVWKDNEQLAVKRDGLHHWSYEVIPDAKGPIKGFTIDSLMQSMQTSSLDVLKIDVEGSEKYIFEGNTERWLPQVRQLIIEVHDNTVPGASRSVFAALSTYNFRFEHRKENLLFTNQDI